MSIATFDLDDPAQIFGNDAAEDEIEGVFASYAIHRPEIQEFLDVAKPLQVVRAYKGEGKSALLRLVESRLRDAVPTPIIIKTTGQAISPQEAGATSDQWVRHWKRQIVGLIASEIGSAISVAFSDDAISLVEEAERSGFRARSFVSTVTDRLRVVGNPLDRTRPEAANNEKLVRRWLEKGSSVWLFVDDIDQNFRNDPDTKTRIATFFVAARQILGEIPEVRIRAAIRPNVWSTLKFEFEALSHVEQYLVDLPWTEHEFLDLMARRIESYLARTGQWEKVVTQLPVELTARYEKLVGLLFENPVPWGGEKRMRQMNVVLHTLSRHRPRWLIELCKVSAEATGKDGRDVIALNDVVDQLDTFGQRRVEDMIAEFRSQCEQIEALLVAFSGQNERYKTDELLKTIDSRIQQSTQVRIVGILGRPGPREIAQFLYQIGFLSARLDHEDGSYDHFAYAQRPNLLRVTTNVDEGVTWEIHPVFRNTLRLKNVESRSEKRQRDLRRERRRRDD